MTDPAIIASAFAKQRTTFIRWIMIITVMANLLFVGLTAFSLRQSWKRYDERAEISTQNLVQLFAGEIDDAVDKIDLTVLTVVDEVEKQLASGGIDGPALNTFIARHKDRLPVIDGLRVVNAQGENAYGTGVKPGVRTSVADRAYFARLRSETNAGLVFSEPVVGRVSKKWSIILARRVNQPDGSFGGLVYGTITLDEFVKMFSAVDVGKHGAVTLRNDELAMIARYPVPKDIDKLVGAKNASPELQNSVKAQPAGGSYSTPRGFDGIERTYSYRKIDVHPLYVTVGLAYEDYLWGWQKEVAEFSVLVVVFFLGTLISGGVIYRDWKRRILATQALAEQQEALRESESMQRLLLANLPVGVIIVDPVTRIIEQVNDHVGVLFGASVDHLIGHRCHSLLCPASEGACPVCDLGKTVDNSDREMLLSLIHI